MESDAAKIKRLENEIQEMSEALMLCLRQLESNNDGGRENNYAIMRARAVIKW